MEVFACFSVLRYVFENSKKPYRGIVMPKGFWKNPKPKNPKKCVVCGAEFTPRNSQQKRCKLHVKKEGKNRCDICGRRLSNKRRENEKLLCSFCKKRERELEKERNKAITRVSKYCKWCGKLRKKVDSEGLCFDCAEYKKSVLELKAKLNREGVLVEDSHQ